MKFVLAPLLFSLAINISCSKNDGTASAQPSTPPPTVKVNADAEESVKLNCTTINFLQGGLENAGGSKTLVLGANDDNRIEVISSNSLNEISVRSNRGQVYLEVKDVQFNYIRGEAQFPLKTSSVTLYPNNSLFNHGYSFVNCSTVLQAQAKDEETASWSCQIEGYKDDKGNLVTMSKSVEIKGSDSDKSTGLFENKEIKLSVISHHSEFLVKKESKSKTDKEENMSWVRTDGFNNQSVTFIDPHYLASGYSESDLESSNALPKVTCNRDTTAKK